MYNHMHVRILKRMHTCIHIYRRTRVRYWTEYQIFIQAICRPIAPLQVHYYTEALPTQHWYCVGVSSQSTRGKCEWSTWQRSLGYVAARARPLGRKVSNQPMSHHAPDVPWTCHWLDRSLSVKLNDKKFDPRVRRLMWKYTLQILYLLLLQTHWLMLCH